MTHLFPDDYRVIIQDNAKSYRAILRRRPEWQCYFIRVLRVFGVQVWEYVWQVQVIE